MSARDGDTRSRWLLGANLALGLFLWFLLLTDVSLAGTSPDLLFPPVTFASALVAAWWCSPRGRRALLPSLVGGGLYTAALLLMVVPPFTLGALFLASEYADERVIQRATSPDGRVEAAVTFRPVGAYSGGNGRTFVVLRHRWLPGLERDVYANGRSYAEATTNDYVRWLDDDTLQIAEQDEPMSIGLLHGELPFFVRLLLR